MAKISIALPVYGMKNGEEFLRRNLKKLSVQSFNDFEVVVADNSDDDKMEKVCREFKNLNIRHFYNPNKGMAKNSNEAIKQSKGELIKLLYQDDFMIGNHSLEKIVASFSKDDYWLVTSCGHTVDGETYERPHYPRWNDEIYKGENTIGAPSVLTIRNDGPLLFDENLSWLLDCDLYKRYYDKYGAPKILDELTVVIYQGEHQTTHLLSDEVKIWERDYLVNKYK